MHSEAVARDLATIVPGLPTITVSHPLNLQVPAVEMPHSKRVRFLFLGMIRPYKGVDLAIKAMEILCRDGVDAELTIAGEFWEPVEKYERLVADLNLKQSVTLSPGYVEDSNVRRLIQGHHVLLFPYRSSSQSGLIPIALGAHRPVIATDVGGLSEEVEHGQTGLLVEPESAHELAAAMKEMCNGLSSFAHRLNDWKPTEWSDVGRAVLRASNLL